MSKNKRRFGVGFTMIEIIAVLAILAMLAAAAAPLMLGLLENGRQTNRMNIARTLFLGAQNQLTRRHLDKTLKSTLTGGYYTDVNGVEEFKKGVNNVADALGVADFPATDAGNADNVHYIGIPAGYTPTNNGSEQDEFYWMLDEVVLDKDIMKNAIMMEYNVQTGVVMSIFYSERFNDGEGFGYAGTPNARNIVGKRGMGASGYAGTADSRKQGYYGVEFTGAVDVNLFDDVAEIYDGTVRPFTMQGSATENILYADFYLANGAEIEDYNISLVGANGAVIAVFDAENYSGWIEDTAEYNLDGVNIGGAYTRYTWVIDHIGGDLSGEQDFSIEEQTNIASLLNFPSPDVRVQATKKDGSRSATSDMSANLLFAEENGGVYGVMSARHLHNIRFNPELDYMQMRDIDLDASGISNFQPIEDFRGTYDGNRRRITNLEISGDNATGNVGLFGSVIGNGSVRNVLLYNATITTDTAANVGGIAGTLAADGTVMRSAFYGNITTLGATATGGLVGNNSGTVSESFNGGFFNTAVTGGTLTENGIGAVNAQNGASGGLAGVNAGTIVNCFNNARVNVSDVKLYEDTFKSSEPTAAFAPAAAPTPRGGIAGTNSGTISTSYATNFVMPMETSGGIAGSNTGAITDCYYIDNGAEQVGGDALNRDRLEIETQDLSFAFTPGAEYAEGENTYADYPFGWLRNNSHSFDTSWGWEDIFFQSEDTVRGLLYYERYTDDSWGISGSSSDGTSDLPPLKDDNDENAVVVNDSYVLEFGVKDGESCEVVISISGFSTQTGGASDNHVLRFDGSNWLWSRDGGTWTSDESHGNPVFAFTHLPIQYGTLTDEDNEVKKRYLLFLDNSTLEFYANGITPITITARAGSNTFTADFVPMFADTMGNTSMPFKIRSPRHLENIGKCIMSINDPSYNFIDTNSLGADYVQELDLDYNVYRELITIGSDIDSITPTGNRKEYTSGRSQPEMSDTMVVNGTFTGEYNGGGHSVDGIISTDGLFKELGEGAYVHDLVLLNTTYGPAYSGLPLGGIAGTNAGTIERCRVSGFTVTGSGSNFGGIAGSSSGVISRCETTNTFFDVTSSSNIGGIAGSSTAEISDCKVSTIEIPTNVWYVGGIAGTSKAMIRNCDVTGGSIAASSGYVGGIAGLSEADIENCNVFRVTVSGGTNGARVGGIAGTSQDTIRDCTFSGNGTDAVDIDGSSMIGGIAGVGSTIINCTVTNDTDIKGVSDVGGIAGENRELIDMCTVTGGTVTGTGDYIGGIIGETSGTISKSGVSQIDVTGAGYVGGIAGKASAGISECFVSVGTVTGTGTSLSMGPYIAGIVGQTTAPVSDCTVTDVIVTGKREYVAGVVGQTNAPVSQNAALRVTVTGDDDFVGGIVGMAEGAEISDAYVTDSAVAGVNNVGGIVGDSSHIRRSGVINTTVAGTGNMVGGVVGVVRGSAIEDVFYMHPARPTDPIQPISSTGGGIAGQFTGTAGSMTRVIFVAPAPRDSQDDWRIYPLARQVLVENVTHCFYLSGERYRLNADAAFQKYPSGDPKAGLDIPYNLGVPQAGTAFSTEFLNMGYLALTTGQDGFIDNWTNSALTAYPYPILKHVQDSPDAWPITESAVRDDQVDIDLWDLIDPVSERAQSVDFINQDFEDIDFSNEAGMVFFPRSRPENAYIAQVPMGVVGGWSTRPTDSNDEDDDLAYHIEVMEAINVPDTDDDGRLHAFMYTNHVGKYKKTAAELNARDSDSRYIELNTEVMGTLYQIAPTTPGQTFYYSFYHASRFGNHPGSGANVTEKMNFYLTPVDANATMAEDGNLVLIRPCWSPRSLYFSGNNDVIPENTPANSLMYNPAASNTVSYGQVDLKYFGLEDVYLYDVWVGSINGNARTGYGVTVWSATPLTTIPTAGVANLNELPDNIIGYWGVEYGWKHYYGEYTVPQGQTRTEFAFQSLEDDNTGNFLDGISFTAPGFISASEYIRPVENVNTTTGEYNILDGEVSFVSPGDYVAVDIDLEHYGETPVGNIVLENKYMEKYSRYFEVVENSFRIDGQPLTGATFGTQPVADPRFAGWDFRTIVLPNDVVLSKDKKSAKITFLMQIKEEVEQDGGTTTPNMQFYFKNQTAVEYREAASESHLDGFAGRERRNASGVAQVFIDPITLTKTVTALDGSGNSENPIGTEFAVNLAISSNADGLSDIEGILSFFLPRNFEFIDPAQLPPDSYNAQTGQVLIRTNIPEKDVTEDYDFNIRYIGEDVTYGYGTMFTHAEARFMYQIPSETGNANSKPINVSLHFPNKVVGIRASAANGEFTYNPAAVNMFEIAPLTSLNQAIYTKFYDDNYDVTPVIRLLDENGGLVTTTTDNNYYIDNDSYRAVLLRGSDSLQFTPKPGKTGPFEINYMVELTAAKAGAPTFVLSSEPAKITVSVLEDKAVYYEEYFDGTFGYWAKDGIVPAPLDDTKIIVESGYGVLKDGMLSSRFVFNLGELNPAELQGAIISGTSYGQVFPFFAKAIYNDGATDPGTEFVIRSPAQLDNIPLVLGADAEDLTASIDGDTLIVSLSVAGGDAVVYTFTLERVTEDEVLAVFPNLETVSPAPIEPLLSELSEVSEVPQESGEPGEPSEPLEGAEESAEPTEPAEPAESTEPAGEESSEPDYIKLPVLFFAGVQVFRRGKKGRRGTGRGQRVR